MKTIAEVQDEYSQAVSTLVPPGYTPVVALLDEKGRKKRRDAAARHWDPGSGQVAITFARTEERLRQPAAAEAKVPEAPPTLPVRLQEAIRALDAAEQKGSFVALKWFRDQFLPGYGVSWAAAPFAGQEVIKDAIDRGVFSVYKVQNPKAPAFPTTAIRVNRERPDVKQVLSSGSVRQRRVFRPVEIEGEPLSTTVIREREGR